MVLPMKKIFLVVQNKNQEESLKMLRKIGVVHLERKAVSSNALTKLMERKTRAEMVLRVLKLYEKPEKKGTKNISGTVNAAAGKDLPAAELVGQVLECLEERKILLEQSLKLIAERNRLSEWGNFDPKDFSYLAEKGNINFYLYKLSHNVFSKLPDDVRYITLDMEKNFIRIVVLDNELPGRSPLALGEFSQKELNSFIADVQDKLALVDSKIAGFAGGISSVENEIDGILTDIEFETARAKVYAVDDVPEDSAVSWLTGFVPQEDLGLVKRGALENGWALLAKDPEPEDITPTKLKHNRFAKLLSPLLGFLNISPGYDEPDISGWFLLFFTIFFGMIFGDAAYGALFLIIAIVGIFKTMKKGVPAGLKLLLLLGSSNFIWGVLTCSWFGMEVHQIPLFLQQISLPPISNVTAAVSPFYAGIVQQNLMIICFTLALLHLCIGRIIAFSRAKSLKKLAEIGSMAMLTGMYVVVLILIASNASRDLNDYIPMMPFVYILGAGFALVFVFSGYEGSVGKSFLDGFKNIISMILGIANVFSDIMSYIRLWAVGLAGAAIASTVVSMAGPMLGNLIFAIFGVIILVFGHGLNLVLNMLSVLVHGVRLNTLEFSGHVGLTWSGNAYKPFKDKEKS